MKLINRLILAFVCLFFSAQQAHSKIQDIRTMAGWYDCFQEGRKRFSPFHGFVWWETKFIEKMFRFGFIQTQEKNRGNGGTWTEAISGDATIRLLYELFQNIEGTLHLVQEETHFAYYLTPELIGKMLHLLQDPISTIATISAKENQNICSLENKKIAGILRIIPGATPQEKLNALHTNQKYHAQCQNLYIQLFQSLFKINLESSLDASVGKSTKREIIKSANKFADLFTKALSESHDLPSIEEQKFLAHTPGYILLSFMYAKVDNIDQFKAYIDQLSLEAIKENAEEILNTKKLDNAWTFQQFDKADKKFIQEHYEEICFTHINDQFYKLQTPPLREHRAEVIIQGFKFISCAEEAIYNFILAILSKIGLYDTKAKVFDLDNLEHQMISWLNEKQYLYNPVHLKNKLSELRSLLEKFNDPLLMHSQASLQAWTEFVSDRDAIKYSCCISTDGSGDQLEKKELGSPFAYPKAEQYLGNQDYYREKNRNESWMLCELAGYPSMFVNLTNDILGLDCNNFECICKLFEFSIKANADEVQKCTDEYIRNRCWNGNPGIFFNVKTIINEQPLSLRFLTTTGHASVTNNQFAGEYDQFPDVLATRFTILNYAINNLSQDHLSCHLLMLYSFYENAFCGLYDNSLKILSNLKSVIKNHCWFARNLFIERVHIHALTDLITADESTFLHAFLQQKFEGFIQKPYHETKFLITEIIDKNLRNDAWILQFCEAAQKKNIHDANLSHYLLRYLLNFYDQLKLEANTYNRILKHIKFFFQETKPSEIVGMLITNLLNFTHVIDSSVLYDFFIQIIDLLFEQTMHNEIFYFATQSLILSSCDLIEGQNLFKIYIEKKLQALFCQPLSDDLEQRSSILHKELEILIKAATALNRFSSSQAYNDLLYQCIKPIFERFQFIFEKGTNDEIRLGIQKLCRVCKIFCDTVSLINNSKIKHVKQAFEEKCLPLIQLLEQNGNFFTERVGQEFFDKHMEKFKKYRTEIRAWRICTII